MKLWNLMIKYKLTFINHPLLMVTREFLKRKPQSLKILYTPAYFTSILPVP